MYPLMIPPSTLESTHVRRVVLIVIRTIAIRVRDLCFIFFIFRFPRKLFAAACAVVTTRVVWTNVIFDCTYVTITVFVETIIS